MVGAVSVASKLGGLKITNDNDPEIRIRTKLLWAGIRSRRPTCCEVGKADAGREEMGTCTARAAGG
jgi:hypothetical protein